MVICGSVFFQRWTLKSQKFVCLLLLRCPAVSLPLHRTYQTWEILWFCLLRVRWEKYWKKNSRHTVWEQIDGHIRLLTFLPDTISCLQWGLILSFLQLQFQFVTCRPEILQPTILELRKLDLYLQSLSNIPGSYFKYLFFFFYTFMVFENSSKVSSAFIITRFFYQKHKKRKGTTELHMTYVNLRTGNKANPTSSITLSFCCSSIWASSRSPWKKKITILVKMSITEVR